MRKKLDYRSLLKNWMQFYNMTTDISRQMFTSIWMHVQKEKTIEKMEKSNGLYLERSDRKSEK